MCPVDTDMAVPRISHPQTHAKMVTPLGYEAGGEGVTKMSGGQMLGVCAENIHRSSLPLHIYVLNTG